MSRLGMLETAIEDMQGGVFDFTCEGVCSNCGECCSNFLPVSKQEVKTIRRYVKKWHISEQKYFLPTSMPIMDWTCPFRNNTEHKCAIYSVRPAICRDFKCDKPAKEIQAKKALYNGKYDVVDMRKEFFRG